MGLHGSPRLTVCSDTAKAKTDVSTFVHAFQSVPQETPMPPNQCLTGATLPCSVLVPSARKKHYPLPASCLPVTVRIFTCYSHSPPLLRLNGTKSGHWPPWLFSFGHQKFWLTQLLSLHYSVKPPLVEPTSCQVDPVFLTFPKRHRPIMNILWHLPPVCFPIQSVPLWSPFLHSSCSWNQYIPNSVSKKSEEKFCYGINQEVASTGIVQLTLSPPCLRCATADLC